jgi:hypothetical protein
MTVQVSERKQGHQAKREEKNRAEGMTLEEARYAARRQLGNKTILRGRSSEMRTFFLLEELRSDLRLAVRTKLGFTSVAIVTLAVGIGPRPQFRSGTRTIVMRTAQDPGLMMNAMRQAVGASDRGVVLNQHLCPRRLD